jgi:hypothetical protein
VVCLLVGRRKVWLDLGCLKSSVLNVSKEEKRTKKKQGIYMMTMMVMMISIGED